MPLSPDSVAACGSGQPTHFVDLESVEDSDEDVAVESLPETQCETSRWVVVEITNSGGKLTTNE